MSGLRVRNLGIAKTFKLFIGGDFPRTESGRSFSVPYHKSKDCYANLCRASRKDFRAAVEAAGKALSKWSERTAYNRGQVLYRAAEMTESKREEFSKLFQDVLGWTKKESNKQIDTIIDNFIYYAGFTDKYMQAISTINPVSSPHHNFTKPEPVGVVALLCGEKAKLSLITSTIAAILCSGNTAVIFLPKSISPLIGPLGEVFATSDIDKGTVNLLVGFEEELAPYFASHMEVQSLATIGIQEKEKKKIQNLAVENMKRNTDIPLSIKEERGLDRILSFVEYKTIWHPIGY